MAPNSIGFHFVGYLPTRILTDPPGSRFQIRQVLPVVSGMRQLDWEYHYM